MLRSRLLSFRAAYAGAFAFIAALGSACSESNDPDVGAIAGPTVPSGIVATAPVGTIDGSLSVDDGGTAHYSIAIDVPPGRQGVQPALSLDYASGAGDGLVGIGWSIGGTSAIARCPKTILHDGIRADVQLDATDRFCLDGQRLISVAGAYGADGTEYRTEQDSGARIFSYGASAPQSFVVYRRDGRIAEYGTSGNSAWGPRASDGIISIWHVSRVRDRQGNYMDFTYGRGALVGVTSDVDGEVAEPLLSSIAYTGAHGMAPRREVRFAYSSRPDIANSYRHGYLTQHARRLRTITTFVDSEPVREYRLAYSNDSATYRSRLTSVTECVHAPNKKGEEKAVVCKPPTRFEWQVGTAARPTELDTSVPFEHGDRTWDRMQTFTVGSGTLSSWFLPVATGDVTGDGIDDMIYGWEDRLRIRPGTGDAATTLTTEIPTSVELSHAIPGDGEYRLIQYDGDGRADLMFVSTAGDIRIMRSRGNDFLEIASPLALPVDEEDVIAAGHGGIAPLYTLDLNGDGRTDILVCQNRYPYEPVLTTDGNVAAFDIDRTRCMPSSTDPVCIDYSRREALVHGTWMYWINGTTGGLRDSGISAICGVEETAKYHGVVGDFDGDGMAEVVTGLDKIILDFDTATNSLVWESSDLPPNDIHFLRSLDVNGDGIHDIVGLHMAEGTDYYHRILFTGTGTQMGSPGNRFVGPASLMTDEPGFLTTFRSSFARALGTSCPFPFCTDPVFLRTPDPGVPLDINLDGRGDLRVRAIPTAEVGGTADSGFWWWPSRPSYILESNGNSLDGWPSNSANPSMAELDSGDRRPVLRGREQIMDANGDGAPDLLKWNDENTDMTGRGRGFAIAINRLARAELMTAVVDGLGSRTEVEYAPLSAGSLYHASTGGCAYPTRCVTEARYVVSAVHRDDGLSGMRTSHYEYTDGRVDVLGRGWLGFAERVVRDDSTGAITIYRYDNTTRDAALGVYPYALTPLEVISFQRTGGSIPSSLRLEGTRESLCLQLRALGAGTYRVDRTCDVTQRFESLSSGGSDSDPFAGLAPVQEDRADYTFDAHGNVTSVVRRDLAGELTTITTDYDNLESDWLIGLQRRRVEHAERDGCAVETVSETTYFPGTNLVDEIVRQPGDATAEQHTGFDYDSFGNVTQVATSAGSETRTTKIGWDPTEAIFATTVIDSVGHINRYEYERAYGLLIAHTDPNGLVDSYAYDGFGRMRNGTLGGGSSIENQYATVPGGGIQITRLRHGLTDSVIETDRLGRVTRVEYEGPDGRAAQDLLYDNRGLLLSRSRPYAVTSTPASFTTFKYDGLGRLRSTVGPDAGRVTTYRYEPLTVVRYTPRGAEHRYVFDPSGHLAKTIEPAPAGGTTRYDYCAGGRTRTITDAAGNETHITYDSLGRRISIDDPDHGLHQYTFDGFDQLIRERDAAGSFTTYTYDARGRLIGTTSVDGTTLFDYDGTGALGKLKSALSPDGVKTMYEYDSLGHTASIEQVVKGKTLRLDLSYDADGRVSRLVYPELLAAPRFVLDVVRDSRGEVTRLESPALGMLWQRLATAADGRITSEQFGNDAITSRVYDARSGLLQSLVTRHPTRGTEQFWKYDWDADHNLVFRADSVHGFSEVFDYDSLDRLVQATPSTGPAQTFAYDDTGNMISASDRGPMRYGKLRPDGTLALPHAVTEIGGQELVYDANGNLIKGLGRAIDFNAANLPRSIEAPSSTLKLAYNAFGERAYAEHSSGTTTMYFDRLFAFAEGPTDTSEQFSIHFDGRPIAQVIRKPTGSGYHDEVAYLHDDQLGSIDTVTDSSGNATAYYSFDAFGARRTLPWTGMLTSPLQLGFTAHEHDDGVGLINMRARMYDPWLRRFISPDPLVSSVASGQALNRYSYVLNRPLTLTDPSGLDPVEQAQREAEAILREQPDNCATSSQSIVCVGEATPTEAGTGRGGSDQTRSSRFADGGQTSTTPRPANAGRSLSAPGRSTPVVRSPISGRPINPTRMSSDEVAEAARLSQPTLEVADGFAHVAAYTVAAGLVWWGALELGAGTALQATWTRIEFSPYWRAVASGGTGAATYAGTHGEELLAAAESVAVRFQGQTVLVLGRMQGAVNAFAQQLQRLGVNAYTVADRPLPWMRAVERWAAAAGEGTWPARIRDLLNYLSDAQQLARANNVVQNVWNFSSSPYCRSEMLQTGLYDELGSAITVMRIYVEWGPPP